MFFMEIAATSSYLLHPFDSPVEFRGLTMPAVHTLDGVVAVEQKNAKGLGASEGINHKQIALGRYQ